MPRYAAQIGSTLTGLRRTHAADLGNVGLDQAEVLLEVARETGLDVPKFRRDLEDRSHLKKIGADYTEGREKYGVFGTPTIISSNGNAAFLKMMPTPPPEDAVLVFDNLVSIISRMPHLGEIKRPEPNFEDSVYEFLADIPQIEPPFLDIAPAGMLPTIISHSEGVKCVLIRSNSSFHGPTTVLPSVKSPNHLSTPKSLPWEALLPCTTR